MTPEQIELAKRLAAHPRWEWHDDMIVGAIGPKSGHFMSDPWPEHDPVAAEARSTVLVPDLGSMATAGVLLGMLSSEAGACVQVAQDRAGSWSVDPWGHAGTQQAQWWPCLGEALAWALLAVWGSP